MSLPSQCKRLCQKQTGYCVDFRPSHKESILTQPRYNYESYVVIRGLEVSGLCALSPAENIDAEGEIIVEFVIRSVGPCVGVRRGIAK